MAPEDGNKDLKDLNREFRERAGLIHHEAADKEIPRFDRLTCTCAAKLYRSETWRHERFNSRAVATG